MKKFDWTLTIKNNILVLKMIGLWPDKDEKYKNIYMFYTITTIFFMSSHCLCQTINIFHVYSDLEDLITNTFVTLTDLLTLLKIYYFLRNIEVIKQLLAILQSDIFQPRDISQRKIVENDLNKWKIIYNVLCVAVTCALILFISFPILDKSQFQLPFAAWYPYNVNKSPVYQLTYIYQTISVMYIVAANSHLDTFIAALMVYIGAQCDILCDYLKHKTDNKAEDFNTKIINSIRHQNEIYRFAEISNKFFNMIVLGQFCVSGSCISLTLFHLIKVGRASTEIYSILFYMTSVILELFLYCWFGNEVEIKSSQIFNAAFESNWINAPVTAKKNLLFLMMKSQKPIQLSTFKLFNLSIGTYMKILRSGWSYFALLREIDG